MAETDRTPDPFKSRRYFATIEAVPEIFASAFPKIELVWFRAFRPEICGYYTHPHHTIHYVGSLDDLLAYGLALPEMIPPGRKRELQSKIVEPGDPSWTSTRRAKGRIEIRVDVLPGPLPALARFGPDRWPFFSSPQAAREYCRKQIELAAGFMDAVLRPDSALATGGERFLSGFGYQYAPEDRAKIAEITRECRSQVMALLASARIQPIAGPSLRLVH